jgi:23S rRNA (guanosine2251-2'-O)-methyltransferase
MGSESRTLYGLKPVLEALRSHRAEVRSVFLAAGLDGPLPRKLRALAARNGVPVRTLSRTEIGHRCGSEHHQGVMATVVSGPSGTLESLLSPAPTDLVVIADGVQDPRNLGSLMRSAEFAGSQAVLVPRHGAAALSPAVAKASAGASEHLSLLTVTNLAQALKTLKQAGYWCYGTVAEGGHSIFEVRFNGPTALVLGGEEKGIRPLVARGCDVLVTIPRFGRIASLNVANAATVVLMEVRRQQTAAGPG